MHADVTANGLHKPCDDTAVLSGTGAPLHFGGRSCFEVTGVAGCPFHHADRDQPARRRVVGKGLVGDRCIHQLEGCRIERSQRLHRIGDAPADLNGIAPVHYLRPQAHFEAVRLGDPGEHCLPPQSSKPVVAHS